jgi:hypothetical protein
MQKQRLWRGITVGLVISLIAVGGASAVHAETATSPHYQITETQFGSSQQSCSGQYCAQTTIGSPTTGSQAGNSTAKFEDITNNEPLLDMIIEPGDSNLGTLTTQSTATKTTTIKVRSYLIGGGYALQIIGDPPKFNGHTLSTPTTPANSVAGTEQFGINVVANTSPTVGTNPVQVPDGQQIFGVPTADYQTPNKFKYASGDTIARGVTDSGHTDYTLSMVVNISNVTPAGHYSGDFMVLAVPVY